MAAAAKAPPSMFVVVEAGLAVVSDYVMHYVLLQ